MITKNPFGLCTLLGIIAGIGSSYALIYLSEEYPMLSLLIIMVLALLAMALTFMIHWRYAECIENALMAEKLKDLYSDGNDFFGDENYPRRGIDD
ncbi:MAG: hypothetical protein ACXABD_22720 [Candidatus Thorarchaeota archaeon]|jgi:hypothetical protein